MLRSATVRVLAANLDGNTVVMIVVTHVHMSFMQICGLVSVADGLVSAARTVNVIMLFVAMETIHFQPPLH
jgi:Na+/H+ antiporter NhaD/arsenite permease-like protein